MGKIFTPSEDIVEIIDNHFSKTGLSNYGVSTKVMSLTKSKDIIKVSKASATTEYLTKREDMVQVFVYEAAFDRLPDEAKDLLVEMALSNISFDTEKDRLMVDTSPFNQIFSMRKKYGEKVVDFLEMGSLVIQQIEDEEREKKEAEREAKKNKNK